MYLNISKLNEILPVTDISTSPHFSHMTTHPSCKRCHWGVFHRPECCFLGWTNSDMMQCERVCLLSNTSFHCTFFKTEFYQLMSNFIELVSFWIHNTLSSTILLWNYHCYELKTSSVEAVQKTPMSLLTVNNVTMCCCKWSVSWHLWLWIFKNRFLNTD